VLGVLTRVVVPFQSDLDGGRTSPRAGAGRVLLSTGRHHRDRKRVMRRLGSVVRRTLCVRAGPWFVTTTSPTGLGRVSVTDCRGTWRGRR
jgi:hypothetical protein